MKSSILIFFFAAAALFTLSACSDVPKGETAEVGEAKQEAKVADSAKIYRIKTSNSVITWIGSKPTGQHNGTINIAEGTLAVADDQVVGGEIVIDIKSLEDKDLRGENKSKLERHLMSEDFFDADQFPTATFELIEVISFDTTETIEDQEQFKSRYTPSTLSEFMVSDPTHKITGNLTIRGTTKSVTFPARVAVNENSIVAEAKFNIDRTDWKLSYRDEASVADKAQDKFIYNTVNVGLSLFAYKPDEPTL